VITLRWKNGNGIAFPALLFKPLNKYLWN
jgi:hypothetical protein